ncbi:MAG TPA: pyruvate kinase [Actinomycetota bacterium]|nr:pyruvate kinase [Actinomycetota bacterium]
MTDPELARTTRTKLVCTLGPATDSVEQIRGLAEAGCDVFRLNLSHGEPETHVTTTARVREVSETLNGDLAVLADLPGPKIRLGRLETEPLRLEAGASFVLRSGEGAGDPAGATTTHPNLARDLGPGDRILLSDGAVELTVVETDGAEVVTRVVRGGRIRSGAGVNVPAERLSLPAITDRDRACLEVALGAGVDLVAQSFVRSAQDVLELRRAMGDRTTPIVAKIETRPAVEDLDAVLEVADAVMVARGDLGVELPLEEIPVVQKALLRAARRVGVATIVATQMLESMTRAPRPTRAEASDVANAVLDDTDAIMLSAETAIGEFPIEAATAAIRIAETAEGWAVGLPPVRRERGIVTDEAVSVARAAAEIAEGDQDVVAIACFTATGRTAALLSNERPAVPIYAFIPDERVRRTLALRWGVRALPADQPADTDEMLALMDAGLLARGSARPGESVVMAASSPAGRTHTNLLKVHRVGE